MPFDSKIIMPLAYNKIRTYIAGQIYDANDTKETINKNSMVITVDADNQVLISAFDSENGLKVEMLSQVLIPMMAHMDIGTIIIRRKAILLILSF